jgi:hypothetical protein
MGGLRERVIYSCYGVFFAAAFGTMIASGASSKYILIKKGIPDDLALLTLTAMVVSAIVILLICVRVCSIRLLYLTMLFVTTYILCFGFITAPDLTWKRTRYLTPLPVIYMGTLFYLCYRYPLELVSHEVEQNDSNSESTEAEQACDLLQSTEYSHEDDLISSQKSPE